jgi:hypothetical protein
MSLSPTLLSPILLNHIIKSPIMKAPFLSTFQIAIATSPISEMKNTDSPIFIMSPLDSLNSNESFGQLDPIKFAMLIDKVSSYGSSNKNEDELSKLPFVAYSISPPMIDIKPLPQLSSMKNSLYERRMKAKEQSEK